MQEWVKGVREKALYNILIAKGLITKEEYDKEYERLKREAWENRHKLY